MSLYLCNTSAGTRIGDVLEPGFSYRPGTADYIPGDYRPAWEAAALAGAGGDASAAGEGTIPAGECVLVSDVEALAEDSVLGPLIASGVLRLFEHEGDWPTQQEANDADGVDSPSPSSDDPAVAALAEDVAELKAETAEHITMAGAVALGVLTGWDVLAESVGLSWVGRFPSRSMAEPLMSDGDYAVALEGGTYWVGIASGGSVVWTRSTGVPQLSAPGDGYWSILTRGAEGRKSSLSSTYADHWWGGYWEITPDGGGKALHGLAAYSPRGGDLRLRLYRQPAGGNASWRLFTLVGEYTLPATTAGEWAGLALPSALPVAAGERYALVAETGTLRFWQYISTLRNNSQLDERYAVPKCGAFYRARATNPYFRISTATIRNLVSLCIGEPS